MQNKHDDKIALHHSVLTDAMENAALVMQGLSARCVAHFTGTESAEVFRGFGNILGEQTHDNTARCGTSDVNVEIDLHADFLSAWDGMGVNYMAAKAAVLV